MQILKVKKKKNYLACKALKTHLIWDLRVCSDSKIANYETLTVDIFDVEVHDTGQ